MLAWYTLLLLPRSTLTENEKLFSTTKDLLLRKTNFGTLSVSGIYYYKCTSHHNFHVNYSFISSASCRSLSRRKGTFLKSSYQVTILSYIYFKISLCFPHILYYVTNLVQCTMVPLSTRMLLWSKFPMYFGQLLQEHIIQN